ncbi:MAG: hypothetical protein GXO21_07480 [Aquificae bacterium]|nr:hypothetical protein [Aquificota bacterium]
MELWVSVAGEKKKLQGSFKSVMEQVVELGKDKEIKLLSVHSSKKELRRLKRELRAHNKDLYQTAKDLVKWFLTKEYRKTNRCLKELRKKSDKRSKELYQVYSEKLKEIESKCETVKAA